VPPARFPIPTITRSISTNKKGTAMRFLIVFFVIGFATLFAYGQQPNKEQAVDKVPTVSAEKPASFWMAKKLEHSKSILEALTKGEFDKVASDAEQMRLIGKLESFVRRSNPDYVTQTHTFELANKELIRQAKRKNSEGAVLAFNQLTSSCVACHMLLREGVQ
jgi:hypothetical protein